MLIGFSGKMKAGKDTSALMASYCLNRIRENKLEELTYENYVNFTNSAGVLSSLVANRIHRFADAMKESLSICLGVDRFKFENQSFKESNIDWLNMSVRELLQKFGTAIRNEVDDEFWVKVLLHKYTTQFSWTWLISDVRFLTEVKGIKELNGILIRINRPSLNSNSTHISEIELDDYDGWDYIIENTGDLIDLFNKIKDICINIESKS